METLKTREKVIIAVFGKPNMGKSHAIMELAKRFPFEPKYDLLFPEDDSKDPMTDIVCKGSFICKKTGKKKKLGICSCGDYKSVLEKYFLPLVIDDHCDMIVVACHNLIEKEGNTYNFIDEVALKYNYRLISTSNLSDDCGRWEKCGLATTHTVSLINGVNINEVFADNMINLIQSIV
ncbi:MAG: hypothetical protein IKX18_03090 [Muribaculaceae bacterium]|nr:hypothetical protein [Muribaculaceae bacterium]